MQSTPDVSLSPESENGQLLNDYLRVDTCDIAYTLQDVTLEIQLTQTFGYGWPTSAGHSWRLSILYPMHPVWQDHWHTCYLRLRRWLPKMPHLPELPGLNCSMTCVSMPLEVHTYKRLNIIPTPIVTYNIPYFLPHLQFMYNTDSLKMGG